MALERIGGVVAPELHEMRAVLDKLAVAVVIFALQAVNDVLGRNVEPGALADDFGQFFLVGHVIAPLGRFHGGHQQGLRGARVLLHPVGTHAQRLLGVLVPQFRRVDGGEADALIDQLLIPGLAHAEAVHGADLHVGHHLRRRHDDGLDIRVRVDAAGGQPVADPQVMSATGEGHRSLGRVSGRLARGKGLAQHAGIEPDLQVLVGRAHRNALRIQIEAGENDHGQRHVVLRHLAGGDEVGHRRQDMRAIDAVALRAQHQIVTRGAPGGLLHHFHIRHAVFGEEPLLLGHDQRRGIGERDEAENGAGCLWPSPLCKGAGGKGRLHSPGKGGGGGGLQQGAAAEAGCGDAHRVCPLLCPGSSVFPGAQNKKRRPVTARGKGGSRLQTKRRRCLS